VHVEADEGGSIQHERAPFHACGVAATFELDTHIVGLIHGFACSRGSQCCYVLLISSRIGHAFPHKNLRLQGYSFRLHPARATLTSYTATPRSTTNSASSSFCTRSVCPICLEGEATLAYLQRVRHSAPSLDVSFLRPYSLWVGDSSRDSYWKPSAKGACAHGPRGGMPPSHEGGIERGRQS